tara:strand:+ start:799 stop:1179 length:381 start_codon:yes stop_codon:yes gene_type:complete
VSRWHKQWPIRARNKREVEQTEWLSSTNLKVGSGTVLRSAREGDARVKAFGVDDETNLKNVSQMLFRICALVVRLRSQRIVKADKVTELDSISPRGPKFHRVTAIRKRGPQIPRMRTLKKNKSSSQ